MAIMAARILIRRAFDEPGDRGKEVCGSGFWCMAEVWKRRMRKKTGENVDVGEDGKENGNTIRELWEERV